MTHFLKDDQIAAIPQASNPLQKWRERNPDWREKLAEARKLTPKNVATDLVRGILNEPVNPDDPAGMTVMELAVRKQAELAVLGKLDSLEFLMKRGYGKEPVALEEGGARKEVEFKVGIMSEGDIHVNVPLPDELKKS